MKIAVWDTYVQREDGKTMHFDILVPDTLTQEETIFNFGKDYLSTKSFKTGNLSAKECKFCHIDRATDNMIADVKAKGYSIIEMENCN